MIEKEVVEAIAAETRCIRKNSGCVVQVYKHPDGHFSWEFFADGNTDIVWNDGTELVCIFGKASTAAEVKDRLEYFLSIG